MDARTFDKSKLPSRHVAEGPARAPHRAMGGPIALVRNGDIIAIDVVEGRLDIEVSEAEMVERRKAWKAPPNGYQSGVLRKYADQVGAARKGAVTHAGGKAEIVCYADI